MSKRKELKQREADLIKEARALLDGDETDAKLARFAEIDKELDKLTISLAREKKQLDRERALAGEKDGNEDAPAAAAERRGGAGDPAKFASFGEQLQAVMRAGLKDGPVDPRLK